MPGSKPSGDHLIWVKEEAAFGDFIAWDDSTDFLTTIGDTTISEAGRERSFAPVSRGNRGRYHKTSGPMNEITFSIPVPYIGSGTAGTNCDARAYLWQAGGLSEAVSGGVSCTYETDVANP